MVDQLVLGGKRSPAVVRVRGIQRRAGVLAADGFCGQAFAAVDPDQLQASVGAQVHAREAVSGLATILMYGDGCAEVAAILGAGKAYVAGEALLETPRPADIQRTLGVYGQLRMVFAIGGNGFGLAVDLGVGLPAVTVVLAALDLQVAVIDQGGVERAVRARSQANGQLAVLAMCAAGQGRLQAAAKQQDGQPGQGG